MNSKKEFYEYYPKIAAGFSNALIKNNGQLGHNLLTDTFKAWYDQLGTKSVYEESYLLEPMQQELRDIAKGKGTMTFETSISAQKTISEIAWTKEGNYFKDDPEILNGGKYLNVSEFTMEQMKKFFEFRKEMTGKDNAQALEGIPTRPNTIKPRVKEMKKPAMKLPKQVKMMRIAANREAVKNQTLAARFVKAQRFAAKYGR